MSPPVNDPPDSQPQPFINALEQTGLIINGGITVFDTDLDPPTAATLYTGASRRSPARRANGGCFPLIRRRAVHFGRARIKAGARPSRPSTMTTAPDDRFTSAATAATTALVNDVLRRIVYINSSDTPPGPVTLLYTFDDSGPGNGQGGQPATATGTTTINVAPDDFTVTQDDAVHGRGYAGRHRRARRAATSTPISVGGIDGGPIAVGETVAVAHGSVTLNTHPSPSRRRPTSTARPFEYVSTPPPRP